MLALPLPENVSTVENDSGCDVLTPFVIFRVVDAPEKLIVTPVTPLKVVCSWLMVSVVFSAMLVELSFTWAISWVLVFPGLPEGDQFDDDVQLPSEAPPVQV